MANKKNKKGKSYIVVYFVVFLVVVVIGLSIGIAAMVNNNGGGSESSTTAAAEEGTAQKTSVSKDSEEITIQMTGDVLLHQTTAGDTVAGAAKATGKYDFDKYFSEIKDYFNCDIGLCDIEGCVDAFGNDKDLSYYPFFNLPYEILPTLKNLGMTTIVAANNHTWDYGADGAYATADNIEKAGMTQVGTYKSAEDNKKPFIVTVKGVKVGMLSWTDSTNGNAMDSEHEPYITKTFNSSSVAEADRILEDVKTLQNSGAEFIIACIHWGTEYQDQPSDSQKQIAKKLIDGGVDILMGNHPHCLQPMEKVSTERDGKTVDRYVFYALGNFIGDQIVLAKDGLKTQQAAIATIKIKRGADGKVNITSGEYLPILTHAYYKNGVKNDYKVLPMTALKDKPISCQYASGTYFSDSYKRVTELLGDALPVSEYGAGKQMPENT